MRQKAATRKQNRIGASNHEKAALDIAKGIRSIAAVRETLKVTITQIRSACKNVGIDIPPPEEDRIFTEDEYSLIHDFIVEKRKIAFEKRSKMTPAELEAKRRGKRK